VAVLGPGVRGLCAVAAAKEAGAGFVVVTGVGERDGGRLAWAERFGADLTVDVALEDPVEVLREATGGRRADVVLDVTAMAPDAFAQAVGLARSGGTVVVAGTRGAGTEAPGFHPDDLVGRELRVFGALGVDRDDYAANRAAMVPLGRQGTAWDVANAALYLASDEAGFVTGICLAVDGGQSARVG